MSQSDCSYGRFAEPLKLIESASYYKGEFTVPELYCNSRWKRILPYSPKYVHFKTYHGTIFQFRLEKFHSKPAILLTSTKGDLFWFFIPRLSIESTMSQVERANGRPHVTGWHKAGDGKKTSQRWGGYLIDCHKRLLQNLDGFELTHEVLKQIYQALLKKEEVYAQCK